MKGSLFENLILNEFIKHSFNRGEIQQPYYWQSNHGKEIDCVLENSERIKAVEIKFRKRCPPATLIILNSGDQWQD